MESYEAQAEFECRHDLAKGGCGHKWKGACGPKNNPICPKCRTIYFVWANHPLTK